MEIETRAIWPLELRQSGRTLSGTFPYRALATIRDRGRVRKETFAPRAFSFAVEDPQREIHLLSGHSFDRPLARKINGTLVLEDTDDGLSFRAELPPEGEQTAYMVDTLKQLRAGLVGGISPGFSVPPRDVVPNAEELVPEPGNVGVQIRVINAAVLYELSLVTRPAYSETDVDVRALQAPDMPRRRFRVWL